MTSEIRKWADDHQFLAPPSIANRDEQGNIIPTVKLLWMTPDPLGAIAAMGETYNGRVVYDMASISDEQRRQTFKDSQLTHLKAPWESVKFHFYIEGVTRSFTHQMVRQRTAVYAQESMRFAIKEDMASEISLPPSIAALKDDDPRRKIWDDAVEHLDEAYMQLIDNGIPSEDARGLAPHAITTRLHYITDLRNLVEHAGNRLCTQAQFEWRIVFLGIVEAIRNYTPDFSWWNEARTTIEHHWNQTHRWQFEELANSELFRPVCYQKGKCPWKAGWDRSCIIRPQVDAFAEHGIPSSEWHDDHVVAIQQGGEQGYSEGAMLIPAIDPVHWLANPNAARKTSGGGGHE